MAASNATSQVFTRELRYEDPGVYLPMQGGSNAKTYQNGQFMGMILNGAHAGYITDCDDTQKVQFVGTLAQPSGPIGTSTIVSGDSDGTKVFRISRPYGWRMQLDAGTAGTIKFGQKVYAIDNQSVTITATDTTYQNCVGRVIGIYLPAEPANSAWATSSAPSPWAATGGTWLCVVPENYFGNLDGLDSAVQVPLLLGRNSNYTVLDATGGAGKFAIGGTIDTALYLLSEGAQNNTKTDIVVFELNAPAGYQGGQNLTLTVNAQRVVAAGTTLTTTLTVNAYLVANAGTEGADICATTVQTFTNTAAADVAFTITGTTLFPGSKLFVQVTGIQIEAGNTGTVKTQINSIRLQ